MPYTSGLQADPYRIMWLSTLTRSARGAKLIDDLRKLGSNQPVTNFLQAELFQKNQDKPSAKKQENL